MSEFEKLINEDKPTLVDFFATWCGPCQRMHPVLEEVKAKIGDKANIIKIDIDQNQALSAQFNIMSVPTMILFKNGNAVWRTVGMQPADLLLAKLYEHIPTKSDEL